MQKNIYSTAKYSGTDSGSSERYHFNVNSSYQERKDIYESVIDENGKYLIDQITGFTEKVKGENQTENHDLKIRQIWNTFIKTLHDTSPNTHLSQYASGEVLHV